MLSITISLGLLALLLFLWSIFAMNEYTDVTSDDSVNGALWVFSFAVGVVAIVYACLLAYRGSLKDQTRWTIAAGVFCVVLFAHLCVGTSAATSTLDIGKGWNDASLAFGIVGLFVSFVLTGVTALSVAEKMIVKQQGDDDSQWEKSFVISVVKKFRPVL